MELKNSEIKEFYRSHIKKYGKEDIRAMGWHDEEEYSIRFDIISQIGDLENNSILDVGCGFGGLYKYLASSGIKFSYLGVDIILEMIEIAKENNPTGKFKVANILTEELEVFDYVFAIGTFNITTKNYDKFFIKMLRKMIDLSIKGVGICFLSDKRYLAKGPYHFENALELQKMVECEFSCKAKIIEDDRLKGESVLFIHK